MKRRIDLRNILKIDVLFAVIYVIYTFAGSTSENYMYVAYSFFIIWILFALISNSRKLLSIFLIKGVFFYLVLLLYILVTGISNAGPVEIFKVIGLMFLYITPLVIFVFYRGNPEIINVIITFLGLFIFFLLIKTIVFYLSNPSAARLLASDETALGNVWLGGGYQLAYSAVIFVAYSIPLLQERISNKFKIFLLGIIILCSVVVILTESTLTIIILVIILILSLLVRRRSFRHNRLAKRYILSIVLFITLFFVFIFSLNRIADFLISLADSNNVVGIRLSQIGYFIKNDISQSNYLMMRLNIPLKSLKSFMQSPILGNGLKYGYIWIDSYPYIGGHGEWADILAIYGIVGSFLYLISILLQFKAVYSKYNVTHLFIFAFILLGIFNPIISIQVLITLFLVIPSVEGLIVNYKDGRL